MVTTFGQVPGGRVFSAKLETQIGEVNHSPYLHAGLPGISLRKKGLRDRMQKSERSTGRSRNGYALPFCGQNPTEPVEGTESCNKTNK